VNRFRSEVDQDGGVHHQGSERVHWKRRSRDRGTIINRTWEQSIYGLGPVNLKRGGGGLILSDEEISSQREEGRKSLKREKEHSMRFFPNRSSQEAFSKGGGGRRKTCKSERYSSTLKRGRRTVSGNPFFRVCREQWKEAS